MIDMLSRLHVSLKFAMTRMMLLCIVVFLLVPDVGHAQVLDEMALQKEDALRAKVTLEVVKKPLNELLDLLQQQSGVKLSSTADSPAKTVRVTARFSAMTLADALCALSRIYGVQWEKTNNGYLMQRYPQDDLHLRLFHRNGLSGLYNTYDYEKEQQETAALVTQIYDSIADDAWKSPNGVLFTALPIDLQEQLREHILGYNSLSSAQQILQEEKITKEDLELRLGSIDFKTVGANNSMLFPQLASHFNVSNLKFIGPGWTLYSSKGELVIPIFPEMHGPSPVEKEQEAKFLQTVKDTEANRLKLEKEAKKVGAR